MKQMFGPGGNLTFGHHKGTHASKLPKGWIQWATENIKGFKEALDAALAQKPPSKRPKGRTYILNPHTRYDPTKYHHGQ